MTPKILTMLQMQDALNQTVHPQWRAQNFCWTRAIMVEGVEALEHYGWKWWKWQEPDMAQVRIELADIWHFIMSYQMKNKLISNEDLAEIMAKQFRIGAPMYLAESDTRQCLEILIARAAAGDVHMASFLALMVQTSMSFDDLYRIYVGKNVLNMFRQNHGYKEGTYIKMWHGFEDNIVLNDLLVLRPDATPEQLTDRLEKLYSDVVANAS